jgi:hypothetical protein
MVATMLPDLVASTSTDRSIQYGMVATTLPDLVAPTSTDGSIQCSEPAGTGGGVWPVLLRPAQAEAMVSALEQVLA